MVKDVGPADCSVADCTRLTRTRTAALCNLHYERQRRSGSTDDPRPTIEDRLWSRIEFADCWLWTGGAFGTGYGEISKDGRNCAVHRVVYELLVGQIPKGLELDHLCRVTLCCNPDHLEPVAHQVNVIRGSAGIHGLHGTCRRGHSLEDAYLFPSQGGRRICRTCTATRNASRKQVAA